MRLRQLECFVRTCELGSISRAADALNVAQPALGLQIKNLEHEFGAALLVRSSRGVQPTPAGEILLEWARDVIERTVAVKARLRSAARPGTTTLRLGLTPSVTQLIAGALLEEAGRRIPGLTLRIAEGLSHIVVGWVETDVVDLALITGSANKGALQQTPVLREPLYLVSAGREADATPVPLSEVLSRPLAMPGENDALRGIVEDGARRIDLPLTVTFEIGSIPAIKDLAARGVAHAVMPFGAVRREVEGGTLNARAIVEPVLTRTLTLVRPLGGSVGRHERELVGLVRDCLAATLPRERGLRGGEFFDP